MNLNLVSRNAIEEEAKRIERKISGGKLYGLSVDDYPNDINMLIVAAYCVGRMDEVDDHLFHNIAYLNKSDKEK